MTQENLQDALGMIDDDMIASVDTLRQKRDAESAEEDALRQKRDTESSEKDALPQPKHGSKNSAVTFLKMHRRILRWGSLAASMCVLVGVAWIWTMSNGRSADSATSENAFYSNGQSGPGLEVEEEADEVTSPETLPATDSSNISDTDPGTNGQNQNQTDTETLDDIQDQDGSSLLIQSYTGTVTLCNAVVQDPGNYVLHLETEMGTLVFTIVTDTQLTGISSAEQLQAGDRICLTCTSEGTDEHAYRCVTSLELLTE